MAQPPLTASGAPGASPSSSGGPNSSNNTRETAVSHCDYCHVDISSVLHIKCAVCKDFFLCLQCFADGRAVDPHQPSHAYRLMHHITIPIFDSEWGADEELLLLEGIEMFGFGNWQEAANHIRTKTKEQAEQHYMQYYLESSTAPLPNLKMPLPVSGNSSNASSSSPSSSGSGNADKATNGVALTSSNQNGGGMSDDMYDWRKRDGASTGGKGASAHVTDSTSNNTGSKAAGKLTPSTSNSSSNSINNTIGPAGEAHIGGLSSAALAALAQSKPKQRNSLAALVGYMEKRGDFETEHDNDAEQIIGEMEFREEDSVWERALKLKVLEIYNRRLDARIERKEFVVSRGLLYKKDRRRSPEEREIHNSLRVFARFHSEAEHEELVQGLVKERRLRQRIEQLQMYRLHGIKTLAEGALFEINRTRRESMQQQHHIRELFTNDNDVLGKRERDRGGEPAPKRRREGLGSASSSSSSSSNESSTVTPFDIGGMEGCALLTSAERVLCTELRLIPAHYLVIKERIIRECIAHGFVSPGQARELIRVDVNATDKVVDFFVSSGWVTPLAPTSSTNNTSSSSSSSTLSSALLPSSSP